MIRGERVIVGISGGVDSAVSALLLREQGYAVEGLFMKNWDEDDGTEYCTARADLADAEAVCALLGIRLHTANFAAEDWDNVIEHFLAEYRAGRTPNPDVLCNAEIKFKAFLDHAMSLGAAHIATGHYAQVREAGGRFQLLRGVDPGKDQSYFLHRLNQAQLSRTLFPVGHLHKREVRRIAEEAKLPNFAKKDSTGICFIGERPFREFLQRYLPTEPGEIRSLDDDKRVGRHQGLMYHTLGQRKGLGIGGIKGGDAEGEHAAWYVARKDLERNVLYVVQGHDHPALLSTRLTAGDLSWVAGEPPPACAGYGAKTRYRQTDAACAIETLDGGTMTLAFEQPQWAVTPGQSAVLYSGDVCLGGGIIA
ncbi:MAG: tRNA 2-thiouridine(34) synthase MnmA [Rhodocyclaceae bacterium]|nr:MAG: tRNA 2-thiouridine(34) synthase MnmA [Rhodocyclaceae bacterium]